MAGTPSRARAGAVGAKERRARIEVTLTGEALVSQNLVSIDDLLGFRFQTLREPYFQFWLPTDPSQQYGHLPTQTDLFRQGGVMAINSIARLGTCRTGSRIERPANGAGEGRALIRGGARGRPERFWHGQNSTTCAERALTRLTKAWQR